MKSSSFSRNSKLLTLLTLVLIFGIAPYAYAYGGEFDEPSVVVTVIGAITSFFILVFGFQVVYRTRGGFLSLAFIFITAGTLVGWVARQGFDFLTQSSVLTTSLDVSSVAEGLGGIALAIGFAILDRKLRG